MVCVGGVLVRDGHILLGLRSAARAHYPDVWDVFGGHARPGEPAEDALARELREEIGITPTGVSLLHVAEHSGADESYEYRIYLITGWEGTPENRQPEEHDEVRWVPTEQLDSIRFAHPGYVALLRHAMELAASASNSVA